MDAGQIYLFFYPFDLAMFHIYLISAMRIRAETQKYYDVLETETDGGPFKIHKIFRPNVLQYEKGGGWSKQENQKYADYLKHNIKIFQKKSSVKIWKLFEEMSLIIATRNVSQCKSHHQKLMKKFNNVQLILEFLSQNLAQSKQSTFGRRNKSELLLTSPCLQIKQPGSRNFFEKPIIPEPNKRALMTDSTPRQHIKELEIQQNQNERDKNIYSYLPSTPVEFLNKPFFPLGFQPMSDDRRQQWIECHKIFLLWTSKLQKLTSEQPI